MSLTKVKLIFIIILLCFCLSAVLPVALCVYAFGTVITDSEFDTVTSMIEVMSTDENIDVTEAVYIVNDVYYSNEQWAGYVVDFSTSSLNGYAIFFKTDESFVLVEASFDHSSAYVGKKGMFVYPSLGYYFVKTDGKYYDAETMEEIIDYIPTEEPAFYAACSNKNDREIVTKKITYTKSVAKIYTLDDFYFNYRNKDSIIHALDSNNCSNVAGVIALNYWNKIYGNDLLKLTADELHEGNISTRGDKCAAGRYMDIFYDYMKTNWFFGTGGTLPSNFYGGFEKLIAEKVYKTQRIKYKEYSQICENISNGYPVFITSKDYYFTTGATHTELPEVQPTNGNYTSSFIYERRHGLRSAHTFIGYGYQCYNFTVNKAIEFGLFVKVADGWGTTCYFNYDLSNITDAVAIVVYK